MKKLIILALLGLTLITSKAQEIPVLESYTLKNGLKIHLLHYGKIDAVSVKLIVNTGEKNESPGQQGYAEITSQMLLQGNTKYSQEQQNDLAFKMGGELSNASGKDYSSINANCLTKNFDAMMDLFSSAILHPSFKKEKLDLMISGLIDYNNLQKMDISGLADVFGDLALYSTTNPLGRNYYKAQLQLITPEKIKEFHDFNYTPKNSAVIVCGKFETAVIKSAIEKYFGSWQSVYGEVNSVALDFPQIKKKEMYFVHRNNATQCALSWSKIAPSLKDKDVMAFSVANRIFNVLLFSEIREKGGKTYSIGSVHEATRFSNLFKVNCSVRNNELQSTVTLFEQVLKNFHSTNISQEDFDKAVLAQKIGMMSSEMPESISSFYNPVIYDFNKRKNYLSDLNALTLDDVQKAIKKYYNPDSYKLIIAGDENQISNQLGALGNVTKFKAADLEKDN